MTQSDPPAVDLLTEGSLVGVASHSDLRTTVAIALADEALTAEVVKTIHEFPDIELVATTTDPAAVLTMARTHVPDVLVIGADLVMALDADPASEVPAAPAPPTEAERGPATDLTHPVAVGLRALCGAVNLELPAVRVIVAAPDGVNSYGAVLGGAIGCIRPADLAVRIADATRRVAWGEGLLTTEWARAVLGDLGGRSSDRQESGPLGRPDLTPTELEVLRRTAIGSTAADIAALHGVPERDVNRGAAYTLMKARRLHADHAIAEPHSSPGTPTEP